MTVIDSSQLISFILEWHKWLFMSESLDYTAKQLVQMLIYLAIKQVTVFMSESLDHTFKQLVQNAESFRKESSDCIYEGVIESHIQIISSKLWLIREWMKCLWVSHHTFKHLVQNGETFRNETAPLLLRNMQECIVLCNYFNWSKQTKLLAI